MVSFTKNSLGFTALAATSTLGAWLIWRALSTNKPPSTTSKPKKKKEEGLFDFLHNGSGDSCDATTREEDASSSSIASDDLERVWTDNNEVDIQVFKQLVEEKQSKLKRPPRSHSKLSLYSHLISKLEQTLDEQHRIEDKLDHLKHLHDDVVEKQCQPASLASASSNIHTNNLPSTSNNNNNNNASVCMVVQRYRGATLLINESEVVRVGAKKALSDDDHIRGSPQQQAFCGLLVYVSFAKGCTQQTVQAASKIIVNLPLLTMGAWGDGTSETMNVMDLAKKHPHGAASIVIVPQANLINKVKSQGKSIQYHGQIDKDEGNTMYHYFVNCVRGLVLEQQCQVRKEVLPEWYQKSKSAQSGKAATSADPSVPPENLFRDPTLYASWDDAGIPLTDAEDEPLTKSAQKKLRKAQAAHRVRHLKYLRDESRQGHKQVEPATKKDEDQHHEHVEHWATAIDPAFCNVVAGTFGKRQSLEFTADMGPFCHVIQV